MIPRKSTLMTIGFLLTTLSLLSADDQSKLPQSHPLMHVGLPGKTWALELDLDGFALEENTLYHPEGDPKSDGRKLMGGDEKKGLIFSAFLFKATKPGDSKVCRETNWEHLKQAPLSFGEVKRSEKGKMAILEYTIKEERIPFDQKNVWAHLTQGDTWIDMHLSKVQFDPKDQKLFDDFLAKVKIVDPYTPNARELFQQGCTAYMKHDFKGAIPHYQRALDLEKKSPTLEKEMWCVLVDNLGMAYGISGDLKRSKEVYEYGISKDPNYPNFYYSLACAYAEMKDLDHAIENLKKAFDRKANVLKGESLPDPKTDDSFQRFLNNEKFQKLLQEITP